MAGRNQGGPWRHGFGTLLLLVPALVVLGVPRVARADANGCTAAPYGMVCIVVEGDGLRVDHAAVVRDKADPAFICKYRGRMTVTDRSGKVIDKRYSSRHKGCTPLRAWFDWYPKKKYPNNSKLCTTFFEDGEEQGTACATIHD
jgi:hypothetical protein